MKISKKEYVIAITENAKSDDDPIWKKLHRIRTYTDFEKVTRAEFAHGQYEGKDVPEMLEKYIREHYPNLKKADVEWVGTSIVLLRVK